MFEWISQLANWFGDLIPRWDLMRPTCSGVKFLPGGKVKVLKPGIYWWWPATTEIDEIEIKRQTLSTAQRLTTKDDVPVLVELVVVYEIDDVIKALVQTNDFEDTIEEVAEKLVIKPIMSRDFNQIREDMGESNEMRNEVARNARSILSDYGVSVIDAYISNFTETKVFSHDGEGMVVGGYDE